MEIFPSIPARPRFAYTSTPVRGVAKPSRSLIGREEETNSAVSFGIAAAMVRAMTASFQPSNDAISF